MGDKSAVCVAIIGTSGRGAGEAKLMTGELFGRMCDQTAKLILDEWKMNPDGGSLVLVSGGSAWADHVAVHLYINDVRFAKAKLLLYLPCRFSNRGFADEQAWHTCGKTLNQLHKSFSAKLGRDSLKDLASAEAKGATLDCTGRGFLQRNLLVAKKASHMIAFSFSDSENGPSEGGTAHTWKHAPKTTIKHHIPIKSILS